MYSIELIERGEQCRYVRGDLTLVLERTYGKGHRIFTESIVVADSGELLSFDQRAQIIRDLCEYFQTNKRRAIFVVWDTDLHRAQLKGLLHELQAEGQLISIEIDNEEKRQARQDRQNLKFLRDGWKVTIEGQQFATPEAYRDWMNARGKSSGS